MVRRRSETKQRDTSGMMGMDDEYAGNPVVHQLRLLDFQHLALKIKYRSERRALDLAHEERRAPLLERRRQRLSVEEEASTPLPGASASCSSAPPQRATPAVPGFWKITLQNSGEFQEEIEEYDEPVLDYLNDIVFEDLEATGASGFKLRFKFNPNPFFSNEELVKVYHTERKSAFMDRLDCTRIEAPTIEWLPGKNVTVEVVTRKAKGAGRKKQHKSKKEEVSRASFFRTFFRNLGPNEAIPEEELEDQEEEDEHDLMDCLLNEDYEQALSLRDYLVPHAVRWYTGEACDELDGDDDDEDDEEEEEDEEEDGAHCSAEEPEEESGGKSVPRKRGIRATKAWRWEARFEAAD